VLAPTSGQHAALGLALRNTVELAVEELGSGLPLEVALVDDACTEPGGTAAAGAVVGDPDVVAVIGPACSAAAHGALPGLAGAGIPAISGAAAEPGLGGLGPTAFTRTIPAEDQPISIDAVTGLIGVQEFLARYQQRYGALPPTQYLTYLAYTYDAAGVLIGALTATGSVVGDGSITLDRAELAAAIRATSGFVGITGTITFEADGDRAP
jgi:ABC-type branched-subunit amino acid transport system substrate-binding protein